MKKALSAIILFCGLATSKAQTYTWAESAACIFYSHCTSCHFPGGPGPFSLIDYGDAFVNRYAIKQAVLDNYMPPWAPDETYQTYAHERLLTQTEKDILVAWVDQGAMAGNAANAPTPPSYSATGSQLDTINFTGSMGSYVNGATIDDYMCFIIPTSFGVDKYISDIELIPGNRAMVHHVLIYTDINTATINALDAGWPGIGYQSFGGTGSNTSKLIGGYVPGLQPMHFPNGMGMKLDANAYIILQMHYPAGTLGQLDSTRINLKFASGSVRVISLSPILSHNTNITPPLAIPANTIMNFTETFTIPSFSPGADSVTLLSVAPHMHNIATSFICYAIRPGNDTVPLINIPNWDFHWQGIYDFRQPLVFGEGTIIEAKATFNNTSSNPNAPNPNNPVTAGEATTEEMMIVFLNYLVHQAGDANIIVDTVTIKPTYNGCQFVGIEDNANIYAQFKIYPNPSSDFVNVSFEQFETGDVQISLVDFSGRILVEYLQPEVGQGTFMKTIDIQFIPAGIYYIRVWNGAQQFTKPLIVTK